jgi:hypothetical protein
MGGGFYSSDTYHSTVGASVRSGKSMAYSSAIRSGKAEEKAHPLLDPQYVNKAGLKIRECLDNAEHPEVTPIVVGFDLTGSNAHVAAISQDKLRLLYGMLMRRGICSDPTVCVAGYGDAYCDSVPLQISQFEADNAIDEALDNMYMEGGGGGNGGETATLLWYFLNKYTKIDAVDKRGKRGYFFMIADECALDLKPGHIPEFIGDEADCDLLTAEANAERLTERWNVFVLQVDNSSARRQNAVEKYRALFGEEHVLPLDDPQNMIETIATAIGVVEETLTRADAGRVLLESGAREEAVSTALAAVEGLFKSIQPGGGLRVVAPDLALDRR